MKTKRRQNRKRRNNTKYEKRGGFGFFGNSKVEPESSLSKPLIQEDQSQEEIYTSDKTMEDLPKLIKTFETDNYSCGVYDNYITANNGFYNYKKVLDKRIQLLKDTSQKKPIIKDIVNKLSKCTWKMRSVSPFSFFRSRTSLENEQKKRLNDTMFESERGWFPKTINTGGFRKSKRHRKNKRKKTKKYRKH
jgi:hypothetical protein